MLGIPVTNHNLTNERTKLSAGRIHSMILQDTWYEVYYNHFNVTSVQQAKAVRVDLQEDKIRLFR